MLSYSIYAAVYLLLLVATLTIWRRRLSGASFAPACGAQFIWSIVFAALFGETPKLGALDATVKRDLQAS